MAKSRSLDSVNFSLEVSKDQFNEVKNEKPEHSSDNYMSSKSGNYYLWQNNNKWDLSVGNGMDLKEGYIENIEEEPNTHIPEVNVQGNSGTMLAHLGNLPTQILSFQNRHNYDKFLDNANSSDNSDMSDNSDEEALDGDQQLSLSLTPFSGIKLWVPGATYGEQDPALLHAFVNGFIPSISPQHCHPKLTPMAIFVSQGVAEPMMRDVFYACGAAFMANDNEEMLVVAKRRYASCLGKFANRLSATQGKIEEWMVAAALLFTLRDKFVGSSPEHPTTHLAKAIELIRILRRSAGDQSVTLKFFVDSFLFNYSVVLITGGRLAQKILPSPFKIFDEWRSVFEHQPFQCFAPWMNNPVFGAATRAFEIAAKCSWLVHQFPLNNADMVVACELLADTYKLELPEPSEFRRDGEISQKEFLHVQQSVLVNDVGKLSCQLLLVRLMNPSLELGHSIVSEKVRAILSILQDLSADTTLWVICSWLLLITGLCCENPKDREFVLVNCYRLSRLFRAAFMSKIGDFLKKAWGTDLEPGIGWELLFDQAELQTVCL